MAFARDKKEKPGFTNIEENLFNALQDQGTLTELRQSPAKRG